MTHTDTYAANPALLFLFIVANLTITAGYIFVAFWVVPKVRIQLKRTLIGGVGFFVLCGLTHIDMALSAIFGENMTMLQMATSWHGLAIHIPQAFAVWMFVTGLYIELGSFGGIRLRDDPAPPSGQNPNSENS